jgi:flagellar assembly protein FliH
MGIPLKNKRNVFKSALEVSPNNKVLIGGADLSDLPSKELVLEQKISEAIIKAENKSKEILEKAEQKAGAIISSAEAQHNKTLEEAKEQGYEDGYQAGLAQAKQELTESLETGISILKSIEQERQESLDDETNRIYKIVCLIAKKIIKKDLSVREDLCLEFIHQAIKNLEYKSEVNILISPHIAKQINQLKSEIIESCPGLEKLTITATEAMQPGDIVLESNKERLDFRIESLFDELIKEVQLS